MRWLFGEDLAKPMSIGTGWPWTSLVTHPLHMQTSINCYTHMQMGAVTLLVLTNTSNRTCILVCIMPLGIGISISLLRLLLIWQLLLIASALLHLQARLFAWILTLRRSIMFHPASPLAPPLFVSPLAKIHPCIFPLLAPALFVSSAVLILPQF